NTGTIGGLTNTTFDPANFTSGQAASEDQLNSVSDEAHTGWYVGADGETTGGNVGPGAQVDFSNTDGNIQVARTETDLTFDLHKDIELGQDGCVMTCNSVFSNLTLSVDDCPMSSYVSGDVRDVHSFPTRRTSDLNTGTIGGLTNTTF